LPETPGQRRKREALDLAPGKFFGETINWPL
jgi:hypothetical protein